MHINYGFYGQVAGIKIGLEGKNKQKVTNIWIIVKEYPRTAIVKEKNPGRHRRGWEIDPQDGGPPCSIQGPEMSIILQFSIVLGFILNSINQYNTANVKEQ